MHALTVRGSSIIAMTSPALAVTLILCAAFACGGNPRDARGPDASGTCPAGGTPRPDGLPDDCKIEHAGCCFTSPADACAAAQCPRESCQILRSYPGKVSCVQ